VRTSGIVTERYLIDGTVFEMYDVGGQVRLLLVPHSTTAPKALLTFEINLPFVF
jgi:hypothetical protein